MGHTPTPPPHAHVWLQHLKKRGKNAYHFICVKNKKVANNDQYTNNDLYECTANNSWHPVDSFLVKPTVDGDLFFAVPIYLQCSDIFLVIVPYVLLVYICMLPTKSKIWLIVMVVPISFSVCSSSKEYRHRCRLLILRGFIGITSNQNCNGLCWCCQESCLMVEVHFYWQHQ